MISKLVDDLINSQYTSAPDSPKEGIINIHDNIKFYLLVNKLFNITDRNTSQARYDVTTYSNRENHHFNLESSEEIVRRGIRTRISWRPDICSNLNIDQQHISYDVAVQPQHYYELKNVILFGPNALCRTSDNEILLESTGNDRILLTKSFRNTLKESGWKNMLAYGRGKKPPVETEFNSIISLVRCAPSFKTNRLDDAKDTRINFGHWLLEELPKLRAAEHLIKKTGTRPKILIDANPPPWLLEILYLLGYEEDQLIEWRYHCAKVTTLILPKTNLIGSFNFEPNRSNLIWLRDRIIDAIDENADKKFSDKLFITRRNANRRKVANSAEAFKHLKHLGYEIYHPENLSFEEQIRLFLNANSIIAPFGANQANLIFSKNPQVIELFPSQIFSPLFFEILNILDADYSHLFASSDKYPDSSPQSKYLSRKKGNDNITINVNQLLSLIDNVND